MDSKITRIIEDYEALLSSLEIPSVVQNQGKLIKINKELEAGKELFSLAKKYKAIKQELKEAEELLGKHSNANDKAFYNNIIKEDATLLELTTKSIDKILYASNDNKFGAIVELRAGTGGEEATLFTQDLVRMYTNFSKQNGWQTNLLSASHSSQGGLKEAIFEIPSPGSYNILKSESGIHRVQRIPSTESSGRIHTSASSVVVIPLISDTKLEINPSDLDIKTYRSSGPGGQSVNTTDSAIRITHKPTGISVTCQNSKSQHKNKEYALKILQSKLYSIELEKEHSKRDNIRKSSIKTGDRSEKIRTYNFPQNRVTDHRIKKSWHDINAILNGNITRMLTDLLELRQ